MMSQNFKALDHMTCLAVYYYSGQKIKNTKNHRDNASRDIEESAVWFCRDASMRKVVAVASHVRSRFRCWIKHHDSSISQDSDLCISCMVIFCLFRVEVFIWIQLTCRPTPSSSTKSNFKMKSYGSVPSFMKSLLSLAPFECSNSYVWLCVSNRRTGPWCSLRSLCTL